MKAHASARAPLQDLALDDVVVQHARQVRVRRLPRRHVQAHAPAPLLLLLRAGGWGTGRHRGQGGGGGERSAASVGGPEGRSSTGEWPAEEQHTHTLTCSAMMQSCGS